MKMDQTVQYSNFNNLFLIFTSLPISLLIHEVVKILKKYPAAVHGVTENEKIRVGKYYLRNLHLDSHPISISIDIGKKLLNDCKQDSVDST